MEVQPPESNELEEEQAAATEPTLFDITPRLKAKKRLPKKLQRNEFKWKCYIRKLKYDKGEEYTSENSWLLIAEQLQCDGTKIFCNEFNIYFHKPRKERCDVCEEVKIKKQEEANTKEKEKHIKGKDKMRENRKNDKYDKKVVLCFDLENAPKQK
ncbi:unnamed protein product [Brassicogethes aeneus]|uniref:Uncharacterized protein n=1 Tax=Brassicogethes aeneus TaxID=1431903 RepID=A0A9P0FGV0_BRAAE|nr:unnamed protein product [Brassicogethes aeneus]